MIIPGSEINPQTANLPLRAIVAEDFAGEGEDELTLTKGTRVVAYQIDEDGWWTVKAAGGLQGIFPGSYLDVVIDDPPAQPAPPPPVTAAPPVVKQEPAPSLNTPAAQVLRAGTANLSKATTVITQDKPASQPPQQAPPPQQQAPPPVQPRPAVVATPASLAKASSSSSIQRPPSVLTKTGSSATIETPSQQSGGSGQVKIASASIYTPPPKQTDGIKVATAGVVRRDDGATIVKRDEGPVTIAKVNIRQGEKPKEIIVPNMNPEAAAAIPRPQRPARKPVTELAGQKTTIGVDDSFDYRLTEEGMKQLRAEEGVKLIQQKKQMENKTSLDDDNMEWVSRVLDNCQRIHALGVVRLYFCPKGETNWRYTGHTGCAALVSESGLDGNCFHLIRLIDLNAWNPNNSLVMEQEFYEGMEYLSPKPWFHTFEMNNGLAGFSFANDNEAREFEQKSLMCMKISARDMIHEDYLSKERAYMYVGDRGWRIADQDDPNLNRIRKKYAAGGIAEGLETTWNKPSVPPDVAAALGLAPGTAAVEKEVELEPDPQPAGGVDGIMWKKNVRAAETQRAQGAPPPAAAPPVDSAAAAKKKAGLFKKK